MTTPVLHVERNGRSTSHRKRVSFGSTDTLEFDGDRAPTDVSVHSLSPSPPPAPVVTAVKPTYASDRSVHLKGILDDLFSAYRAALASIIDGEISQLRLTEMTSLVRRAKANATIRPDEKERIEEKLEQYLDMLELRRVSTVSTSTSEVDWGD
mgnify:CR=1 FL=1